MADNSHGPYTDTGVYLDNWAGVKGVRVRGFIRLPFWEWLFAILFRRRRLTYLEFPIPLGYREETDDELRKRIIDYLREVP